MAGSLSCTKAARPADGFMRMTEYKKICDFQNLYKAHKVARLGKRNVKEVIDFELNLAQNLTRISDSLKNRIICYKFVEIFPSTARTQSLD